MELTKFTITNSVYVPERVKPDTLFEEKYISLRNREKRIYSDEEVNHLPIISAGHPHFKEWKTRKRSAEKFINYLEKKTRSLNILEIGCGNGWLCNQLSKLNNSVIFGNDINFTELQQAARIFKENKKIHFVYGDIRNGILSNVCFDIILFASSIQYFESLKEIIQIAMEYLNDDGEIHILDSPFYNSSELISAQLRAEKYYSTLGFPEMTKYYFQHCLKDLESYDYKFLYKPGNKLFRKNPFPWIYIKKKSN